MKNPHGFFKIIGVAGQMGSGKTVIASEICKLYDASKVSFGDFVRAEAVRRNIALDRSSLQLLGETLIKELGYAKFVESVLTFTDITPTMVLDGVRHVEIWKTVLSFSSQSILIYLDIPVITRLNRLKARDNLDDDLIKVAMRHPMEINIPLLLPLANIVLQEKSLENMIFDVMSAIDRM